MTKTMMTAVCAVAAGLAFSAGPAAAAERTAAPRSSPPYTVTVTLELASPFVADGRSSIAQLVFRAVFSPVVFEFDAEGDPLLGRSQIETSTVKGVFTRFVLNDVQKGEDRRTPAFLTPRPADFQAGLGIESEPTAEDDSAAASRVPPEEIRLSFWTDFGSGEITWGSALGTGRLDNQKAVFAAPFRDLMAGRRRIVTFPYEGKYPEDKGTWKIEFAPGVKIPK